MRQKLHESATLVAVAAILVATAGVATAQSGDDAAWEPPRTADGQPDISGVWTNFDPTPFEAPDDADLERLAPLAAWFPGSNTPQRAPAMPDSEADRRRPPQGPWGDGPGSAPRNERRRSMVVEPSNGRIPVRDHARATRDYNLIHLTDSYMNHTPWERCITRGVPGGIFPPGYGAGYRILQTPGHVVILYEMIHEARIIPIDDRPLPPGSIRMWNGASRGRWEGNTLVVEVGNYNSKGAIATNIATRGARGIPRTEDLRVVERFTIAGPDTLEYEVTIEDPAIYTDTWKVAMPLNRDATYTLFEYACHEGNYGLANSLSAGRAEDREAAEGR
ncbi:MAG: hypothetical protein OXG04_05805 [Acidobacteria bacterium]|nr:hypothetical protein [Acidobacteriota bacterium]